MSTSRRYSFSPIPQLFMSLIFSILAALNCAAADFLTQEINLSPDTLSPRPTVYRGAPGVTAFEIDVTFRPNSALKLRVGDVTASDSVTILLHLSDAKVNFNPTEPTYLIDVKFDSGLTKSFTVSRAIDINAFVGLRLSRDSLAVATPIFSNSFPLPAPIDISNVEVAANGRVTALRSIFFSPRVLSPVYHDISPDYIEAARNSANPLEGEWLLYNHALDTEFASLGGNYRILSKVDGKNLYLMYLDGAKIFPGRWLPGMIKATAQRSEVANDFVVDWVDAEFHHISRNCYMTIEGDTLTIQLPYMNSSLTFLRIH